VLNDRLARCLCWDPRHRMRSQHSDVAGFDFVYRCVMSLPVVPPCCRWASCRSPWNRCQCKAIVYGGRFDSSRCWCQRHCTRTAPQSPLEGTYAFKLSFAGTSGWYTMPPRRRHRRVTALVSTTGVLYSDEVYRSFLSAALAGSCAEGSAARWELMLSSVFDEVLNNSNSHHSHLPLTVLRATSVTDRVTLPS
jgi:hypothetical protein